MYIHMCIYIYREREICRAIEKALIRTSKVPTGVDRYHVRNNRHSIRERERDLLGAPYLGPLSL